MTGTLTTTDPTLPHSVGGIIFQNRNISATSLTINGVPYTSGAAAGVDSINSLSGAITLTAGTNISLYTSGNSIVIGVSGSTGGTSGGVTSLNTLSGVLTLSAGTNISLFTSGSNIIVRSTISGTYGGVILSGSVVTADSIDTDSAILSSIGGVKFQGNQLSASAVQIPGTQQSVISGIKLSNCVITLSGINAGQYINTCNISISGGIDICGGFADSIVGTVNGLAGQVEMAGGNGIQVINDGAKGITIATAPVPITVINYLDTPREINLTTAGRGDIYLFPTDFNWPGAYQLNFPVVPPDTIPAGTSWRITNSSPCNVGFQYNLTLATLPNLDPGSTTAFNLSGFYSILLVKTTNSLTTYYNVNN
jgi:hypothetical protein